MEESKKKKKKTANERKDKRIIKKGENEFKERNDFRRQKGRKVGKLAISSQKVQGQNESPGKMLLLL